MGKGNTYITDDDNQYIPTYYIEYYEHEDEINEDTGKPYCDNNPCTCNDMFFDDVLSNIRYSILPLIKGLEVNYSNINNVDFNEVFSNEYMKLKIQDNEWSLAIACCPVYSESYDKIYVTNHLIYKSQANKFMKELNKMYNLRGRGSAWTSYNIKEDERNFY